MIEVVSNVPYLTDLRIDDAEADGPLLCDIIASIEDVQWHRRVVIPGNEGENTCFLFFKEKNGEVDVEVLTDIPYAVVSEWIV